MSTQQKVAIVTGGGRDIGKAISIKLASMGVKVVINYLNNRDEAATTQEEILKMGGEAILVKADVTNWEDIQNMIAATQEAFGPKIDVLVNNAGGLIARKTIDMMDEEFWDKVIGLNLKSVFMMTKAVVPHMSHGASIVNLASQAGRDGGGGGASAYATAKGAVMTFTRAMAKELGPKGIRVNALCPGMISTTFHDVFTNDEIRTKVASSTPLKREGEAKEVADLVGYLANGEASFVTGTNIDINGGLFFS
ncbi:MAG: glucose 1-dehydrogenase [Bacteroidia bacterium]|nr:glucose 1-dehydrogenase [Bacteroidia bacterium]